MKKAFLRIIGICVAAVALVACGQRVEVPPAHVGKIMTKDGYQEGNIPTSKIHLNASGCIWYCDRLVLLDVSDKAYQEEMSIFIPDDKLNLGVQVRATLSINPKKAGELFNAISPTPASEYVSVIKNADLYNTYGRQIVQAEVREYLSTMSISQIASSNEKINADLRERLSKAIEARTPFIVRHIGLTNLQYPPIITKAQEAAAERREAIQQEEAQTAVSTARLERELNEARLQRAIEKEKAETEAMAQATLAASVDPRVLELRRLEVEKIKAERWNGQGPTTIIGADTKSPMVYSLPIK